MKPNFKIDFKAQTAAHFKPYPGTEQTRKIIARNNNKLQSIADNAKATISSQALEKLSNSLLGKNVDTFV